MANHPGSIEHRGGTFRVRLCVAGERHYFTLDADQYPTKADAAQFAREKDAELRRRSGRGLPGPMPVSELLARFEDVKLPGLAPNTRKTYRHSLEAFRAYFVTEGGDPKAHEVRPGQVRGFLHWRRTRTPAGSERRRPLSARTLAKDRAVLHAVFAFGEELEVVQGNPVGTVKPPKGDAREPLLLDADQYEALIEACADRPMLRAFVLVLGESGVRCESEALWLRWEDVDLERGFLTVESVRKGRRTKSGKMRKVPMTPRLREALREHAAAFRMATYPVGTDGHKSAERSPWLFHHPTTRRTAKAGKRIKSLRAAFAGAVKRAGLPEDLNQHDLRHRRVTTWLAAGKSPVLVQKAMGHSDLQTTMRYTHLVSEDLLALVEDPEARALRALAEG